MTASNTAKAAAQAESLTDARPPFRPVPLYVFFVIAAASAAMFLLVFFPPVPLMEDAWAHTHSYMFAAVTSDGREFTLEIPHDQAGGPDGAHRSLPDVTTLDTFLANLALNARIVSYNEDNKILYMYPDGREAPTSLIPYEDIDRLAKSMYLITVGEPDADAPAPGSWQTFHNFVESTQVCQETPRLGEYQKYKRTVIHGNWLVSKGHVSEGAQLADFRQLKGEAKYLVSNSLDGGTQASAFAGVPFCTPLNDDLIRISYAHFKRHASIDDVWYVIAGAGMSPPVSGLTGVSYDISTKSGVCGSVLRTVDAQGTPTISETLRNGWSTFYAPAGLDWTVDPQSAQKHVNVQYWWYNTPLAPGIACYGDGQIKQMSVILDPAKGPVTFKSNHLTSAHQEMGFHNEAKYASLFGHPHSNAFVASMLTGCTIQEMQAGSCRMPSLDICTGGPPGGTCNVVPPTQSNVKLPEHYWWRYGQALIEHTDGYDSFADIISPPPFNQAKHPMSMNILSCGTPGEAKRAGGFAPSKSSFYDPECQLQITPPAGTDPTKRMHVYFAPEYSVWTLRGFNDYAGRAYELTDRDDNVRRTGIVPTDGTIQYPAYAFLKHLNILGSGTAKGFLIQDIDDALIDLYNNRIVNTAITNDRNHVYDARAYVRLVIPTDHLIEIKNMTLSTHNHINMPETLPEDFKKIELSYLDGNYTQGDKIMIPIVAKFPYVSFEVTGADRHGIFRVSDILGAPDIFLTSGKTTTLSLPPQSREITSITIKSAATGTFISSYEGDMDIVFKSSAAAEAKIENAYSLYGTQAASLIPAGYEPPGMFKMSADIYKNGSPVQMGIPMGAHPHPAFTSAEGTEGITGVHATTGSYTKSESWSMSDHVFFGAATVEVETGDIVEVIITAKFDGSIPPLSRSYGSAAGHSTGHVSITAASIQTG